MTTTKIYKNIYNPNKFIEVHNDGHYHNSVRQFMAWEIKRQGATLSKGVNFMGDTFLHRMRANYLRELLKDYNEVK